jgi:hypothetical protein
MLLEKLIVTEYIQILPSLESEGSLQYSYSQERTSGHYILNQKNSEFSYAYKLQVYLTCITKY